MSERTMVHVLSESYVMRIRDRLGLYVMLVHWLVLIAASGCSLLQLNKKEDDVGASGQSEEEVELFYRTESDRLNLASGASPAIGQQIAGQFGHALPPMSIGTLQIRYPHPQVPPGFGLARVDFRPSNGESALADGNALSRFTNSVRDDIKSFETDLPRIASSAMPIPKWQIDAIVNKLEKQRFFRRSKQLSPNVYLAVARSGVAHGKNYKSLAELDSLVLSVRHGGRPRGRGPLSTMPPPQNTASTYNSAPYPNAGRPGMAPSHRDLMQPSFAQPNAYQPNAHQPNAYQPAYSQPGYSQAYSPGYAQPGYAQPGFSQPGYAQPGYAQPGHAQPGYAQPGFSQPGFSQPGHSQPGFSHAGYPPQSVAQPNMPPHYSQPQGPVGRPSQPEMARIPLHQQTH